jgi:hypothetical protein
VQQRRNGDVVGQIRDHRGRLDGQLVAAKGQDVAVDYRQALGFAVGVLGDGLRQPFGQYRIDFDGGDGRAAVEQRQGQ